MGDWGRVRSVIAAIVAFSTLAGCSGSALDDSPQQAVSVPVPPSVVASDPSASVEELVATLVDGVGPNSANPSAGWLRVYDQFGIPVWADGAPLGDTGDDLFGPQWWWLWATTEIGSTSKMGILAGEMGRLVVPAEDVIVPADEGAALVADLRSGLVSEDPEVRVFAEFVRQRVLQGPASVDLGDETVPASSVSFDVLTAQLIAWVVVRGMVDHVGRTYPELADSVGSVPSGGPLRPAHVRGKGGCADVMGADETGEAASAWLLSKAAKGKDFKPLDLKVKGYVDLMLEELSGGDATLLKQLKFGYKFMGYFSSLLSLLLEYLDIDYSGAIDPMPLVRTKSSYSDGQRAEGHIDIYSKTNASESSQAVSCLISYLGRVSGLSMRLPKGGPLPGVEVVFTPGKGFGTRVWFPESVGTSSNPGGNRQTADSSGSVRVVVEGLRQKADVPRTAQPVDREYSFRISAQLTAETFGSLFDQFTDSFGVASGNPAGIIQVAINTLRVMHWDLGEAVFPMTDWTSDFRVEGTWNDYTWSATKCDGGDGTWTFTIEQKGVYPVTLDVPVDHFPGPGEPPLLIQTNWVDWNMLDNIGGWHEFFMLQFYADGSQTPWGAPAGSPAIGIDEYQGWSAEMGYPPNGLAVSAGEYC